MEIIPRYLGQKAYFINLLMPNGKAQDNLTPGKQEVMLPSSGMLSLFSHCAVLCGVGEVRERTRPPLDPSNQSEAPQPLPSLECTFLRCSSSRSHLEDKVRNEIQMYH